MDEYIELAASNMAGPGRVRTSLSPTRGKTIFTDEVRFSGEAAG